MDLGVLRAQLKELEAARDVVDSELRDMKQNYVRNVPSRPQGGVASGFAARALAPRIRGPTDFQYAPPADPARVPANSRGNWLNRLGAPLRGSDEARNVTGGVSQKRLASSVVVAGGTEEKKENKKAKEEPAELETGDGDDVKPEAKEAEEAVNEVAAEAVEADVGNNDLGEGAVSAAPVKKVRIAKL